MNPNVYVIAGANGAGKTTFAKVFLPNYVSCRQFVNADLIASGLSPFSPETASLKAGRLLLQGIHAHARKGVDFAFETTLAGVTYNALFKKLKEQGYAIHLFFLWIPDVKLALARIADRVKRGGHNIPGEDVERRFHRGLKNFFKVYQPLSDSWILFDNSGKTPRVIAREKLGKRVAVEPDLYEKVCKGAGVR